MPPEEPVPEPPYDGADVPRAFRDVPFANLPPAIQWRIRTQTRPVTPEPPVVEPPPPPTP